MNKFAGVLFSVLIFCTISVDLCAQNTGYLGKKNLIGIETLSCVNNDIMEREYNVFSYNKNTSKLLLKYGIIYERALTHKVNAFITSFYGRAKTEYEIFDYYYYGRTYLISSYLIYNQIGASTGLKYYLKNNSNIIGNYIKLSGGITQNHIRINSEDYHSININELNEIYHERTREYFNYLDRLTVKSNTFIGTLGYGEMHMLNDKLALDLCVNLNVGMNYNNFFILPKSKYEIETTININGTKRILLQNVLLFAVSLKFVG